MSYDQEKYYKSHVATWNQFIKKGVYITIGIIVLVILMAIFLI